MFPGMHNAVLLKVETSQKMNSHLSEPQAMHRKKMHTAPHTASRRRPMRRSCILHLGFLQQDVERQYLVATIIIII